ncbi:acyl-CoA dehydrogenase family protein [Nocardia transvalensis]|uniref:acyl-CoA dehydrogenase family protein n=1 Tax=Nocardia transvalensis TaxID=37333 RepID=UPI00189339B0|nr:acyl-CoA dehydrogenase family protein [Nocardia transvalensis]MBF6330375.1 acyl-CoA dehydrogenase family protein [Nocardia transvalensis]
MLTKPFHFTEQQERFRAEVHELLSTPTVQQEVARGGGGQHARRTYELLGERGWLAAHWPAEHGGRGAGWVESAIVAEELALAGVPDSARINTIDNIGSTILSVGTAQQRAEYLLPIARGKMLGCVLFSEPDVGSDLASLRTTATPEGQGWRLNGVKTWTVGADWSDIGVCAARTPREGGSKYADISLFTVPMTAEGVHVEPVSGVNPEPFHRVSLNNVELTSDALLGAAGQGWELINSALGLERTGIPFWGRARRWLDLVSALSRHAESAPVDRIVELDAELHAARLLAWSCVDLLSRGEDMLSAAAAAKWWTSELASAIARLGQQVLATLPPEQAAIPAADKVAAAVREAPGLTLAAGTSEMMLATVWSSLPAEGSDAPL